MSCSDRDSRAFTNSGEDYVSSFNRMSVNGPSPSTTSRTYTNGVSYVKDMMTRGSTQGGGASVSTRGRELFKEDSRSRERSNGPGVQDPFARGVTAGAPHAYYKRDETGRGGSHHHRRPHAYDYEDTYDRDETAGGPHEEDPFDKFVAKDTRRESHAGGPSSSRRTSTAGGPARRDTSASTEPPTRRFSTNGPSYSKEQAKYCAMTKHGWKHKH